jgi:hypothetical protein
MPLRTNLTIRLFVTGLGKKGRIITNDEHSYTFIKK